MAELPDAATVLPLTRLDAGVRRQMTAYFLELGLRLEKRCEFARAAQALERAVSITPEDATPRLVLGLTLVNAGRYEDAEEQLQAAGRLARQPERQRAARLALARLYQRRGDHERAIRACRVALELDPASTAGLSLLADSLIAAGRPGEARAEIERALEQNPASPNLQYALGRVLRALGRPEEAITVLGALVARHARKTAAVMELALAMKQVGRTEEALALFERVLQLEPTHLPALEEMAEITAQWPENDPWTAVAVQQGLILDPDNTRLNACWKILESRREGQATLDQSSDT